MLRLNSGPTRGGRRQHAERAQIIEASLITTWHWTAPELADTLAVGDHSPTRDFRG